MGSSLKKLYSLCLLPLWLSGCVNDEALLVQKHKLFDQEKIKTYQFQQYLGTANQPADYVVCGDAMHPCFNAFKKETSYFCYSSDYQKFYAKQGNRQVLTSNIDYLTCKKVIYAS